MTAILVVLTIIFFLGVDWAVRKFKREPSEIPAVPANSAAGAYPLRIPEGIFFAKSHTWLNLFPSGKIRLGLDDFLGNLLEKPEVVFVHAAGDHVQKGDPLMYLRDGDRQLTIRAPISGNILNVNSELEAHPELMRESLFSAGWAYTIQPQRFEELKQLMFGTETRSWMMAEFRRLRDMLAEVTWANTPAPAYLQDGGLPSPGMLKNLSPDSVRRLEQEFLEVH